MCGDVSADAPGGQTGGCNTRKTAIYGRSMCFSSSHDQAQADYYPSFMGIVDREIKEARMGWRRMRGCLGRRGENHVPRWRALRECGETCRLVIEGCCCWRTCV